jgi:hypothetical protein
MEAKPPTDGNLVPDLISFGRLEKTLDIWCALWDPRERQAFEKALAQIVTGKGARTLRLEALAACHIIATPEALAVAQRAVEERWFTEHELDWIAARTLPLYRLHQQARQLRGHPTAVHFFVELYLMEPHHPVAGPLLDVIDLCDLYLVGQSSPAPIAMEAAHRILSRGKQQRERLARCLGVAINELAGAVVPPKVITEDEYAEYGVS